MIDCEFVILKMLPSPKWLSHTPFPKKCQKTHVTPLRSGLCVQWEWVHSPFTPGSIDPAVDAGFSHLGLAVNVNIRLQWTCKFLTYFLVSFFSFFIWCVMSSRCNAGFQFLMDFTFTEANTYGHRAENDSCLTCVSISTERFCWDKLKLTAQYATLSLVKSQPSSPSTPLSLPAINLNE